MTPAHAEGPPTPAEATPECPATPAEAPQPVETAEVEEPVFEETWNAQTQQWEMMEEEKVWSLDEIHNFCKAQQRAQQEQMLDHEAPQPALEEEKVDKSWAQPEMKADAWDDQHENWWQKEGAWEQYSKDAAEVVEAVLFIAMKGSFGIDDI